MSVNLDEVRVRKSLHVPYLSVSAIYPNDDGGLRREAVVQVDTGKSLAELYELCSSIASEFGGEFGKSMKIDRDMLTFVITYDKYVNPPPMWNVYREDPL